MTDLAQGTLVAQEKAKLRKVLFFESVTLGAFGVMLLLGVLFWAVGSVNRRQGLTGEAETARTGRRRAGLTRGANPSGSRYSRSLRAQCG